LRTKTFLEKQMYAGQSQHILIDWMVIWRKGE
jgi:hypothetical protein